jgi:hypothetical protein
MLTGSMQYLGFTVGQALEPIAAFLAPIVDKIAEWVSGNEGTTRTIFLVVLAVGALLLTLGQLVLGISSLIDGFKTIKLAMSTGWIANFGGALVSFGIGPILAIIAILAILYIAWKTNFGGIQEFVRATFGQIWNTIKDVIANVVEIFKGLFMIIEGLFTGDMGMVWNGFLKMLFSVIKIIVSVFFNLGSIIINIFIYVVNTVIGFFQNLITMIVTSIGWLIQMVDKIPGIDLGGAVHALNNVKNSALLNAKIPYISSEASGGAADFVNNVLDKIEIAISVDLDGEKVGEAVAKPLLDSIQSNGA